MNAETRLHRVSAVQITCIVPRLYSGALTPALDSLGITDSFHHSARRTMLRERTAIRGSTPISQELVDIVRFTVPAASANTTVAALTELLRFGEPGRGSIVQRHVTLEGLSVATPSIRNLRAAGAARRLTGLAGLCCIVPRGDGTEIARVLLETGLGAPVVAYGRGVGSREKLGLIRVTIPAEKELVTLMLNRHDVEEAFGLVTDVMKLGRRPGAGFCYWYPLGSGILDTKIWIGRQPHVASMEQVISAIDVLTGDTTWRRKFGDLTASEGKPMKLAICSIHGPERETEPTVRAALAAGAGGATRSLARRERTDGTARTASAHEVTDIIMVKSALPKVLQAIAESGLYERDGFAEISEAGAASGYRTAEEH
jgi:hypothetical protein